ERLVDGFRRHAVLREHAAGGAVAILRERDQEVLGRDVVVLEAEGLRLRALEALPRALAQVLAASAADRGELGKLGPERLLDRVGTGPELGKEVADDAVALLGEGGEQVVGLDRLVVLLLRARLGGRMLFLWLFGVLMRLYSCVSLCASWCAR